MLNIGMASFSAGVHCFGLRQKAYGLPDPYLKLYLGCGRGQAKLHHHGQQQISAVQYNTIDPFWDHEVCVWGTMRYVFGGPGGICARGTRRYVLGSMC